VNALLDGGGGAPRAVETLLQLHGPNARCRRTCHSSEQPSDAGEYGDTLLERDELRGRQRGIGGDVRLNQSREVSGVLQASLRGPFADRLSIAGRRRIVMRSTAGSRVFVEVGAPAMFDSSSERRAIDASRASDTPRLTARVAKRCFSSGVTRTVIEGRIERCPFIA
jgi:hypothetical protein